MMDFMELRRDTTRLRKEAQYLKKTNKSSIKNTKIVPFLFK